MFLSRCGTWNSDKKAFTLVFSLLRSPTTSTSSSSSSLVLLLLLLWLCLRLQERASWLSIGWTSSRLYREHRWLSAKHWWNTARQITPDVHSFKVNKLFMRQVSTSQKHPSQGITCDTKVSYVTWKLYKIIDYLKVTWYSESDLIHNYIIHNTKKNQINL